MKAAVTGGAGYLGFSLVRKLAHDPDVESVMVIDNLARRNYALFVSGTHGPNPVSFRQVEMLDGVSLESALDGVDTVFHLAAHATTPNADNEVHVFDQVNNWGTAQLARSIEKSSSVRTVVHASSFAVYGSSATQFDEASNPSPTSAYGVSKLASEAHLRRLGDRHVHIVRAGNVFGFNPAIRFDSVVNRLAFDACTQRQVQITGDGSQTRPFVDVDTLAHALLALAQSPRTSATVNLATSNASINDLVEILDELVPGIDRVHVVRDHRMQQVTMPVPSAVLGELGIVSPSIEVSIAALVDALTGSPRS